MSATPAIKFALLTEDPRVKSKVNGGTLQQTVTLVKDCSSLGQAMQSQHFTGVIIDDPTTQSLSNLSSLNGQLNLSKTFVYAGPLPAWRFLNQIRQVMEDQAGEDKDTALDSKDANLANYVEKKLGDFVKAMNVGSGNNLYPTLMRAVERPLIELALRETNGNQLKAARLLGLNRNTLRKKITEFQISVRRVKESASAKRKSL